MKKTLLSFLIMMSLLLVGCTAAEKSKYGTDVGELPPALIMAGQNFFANTMSIDELPEDYEYMGDLTDEEANDTGLAGCKYYAKNISVLLTSSMCIKNAERLLAKMRRKIHNVNGLMLNGFVKDLREIKVPNYRLMS